MIPKRAVAVCCGLFVPIFPLSGKQVSFKGISTRKTSLKRLRFILQNSYISLLGLKSKTVFIGPLVYIPFPIARGYFEKYTINERIEFSSLGKNLKLEIEIERHRWINMDILCPFRRWSRYSPQEEAGKQFTYVNTIRRCTYETGR